MEIGTVLWHMVGKRHDKEIRWYAEPKCIEYIDNHKYLFGDGCGGSLNNIGIIEFPTREECIDHFLESHDSLIEPIGIDEKSPDNVYDMPRTDWQDYLVTKFDSIQHTSVYLGGMNGLKDISDRLKWHTEYAEGLNMDVGTLTLTEIADQVKKRYGKYQMITVIQNAPLTCRIFQYGNYSDGKWYKLGEVMGYA